MPIPQSPPRQNLGITGPSPPRRIRSWTIYLAARQWMKMTR